jgi:hypothetical protein
MEGLNGSPPFLFGVRTCRCGIGDDGALSEEGIRFGHRWPAGSLLKNRNEQEHPDCKNHDPDYPSDLLHFHHSNAFSLRELR